ncbi:hypothetical protein HanXRQr2_Chr01g0004901 [Helianthus annuus]|uniref:Secreted protein n=1 Tax=Helianthus annuus TaxID=4232 RepID=A0A9K3JSX1_HELAN|nr:hypothetical protein HanXRQr2_Chr01g0004901 [Helianthus annuus]
MMMMMFWFGLRPHLGFWVVAGKTRWSGGSGCFGPTSSGREPPFVSFCIFLFRRFNETDADIVQLFEIGSVTVQMSQHSQTRSTH